MQLLPNLSLDIIDLRELLPSPPLVNQEVELAEPYAIIFEPVKWYKEALTSGTSLVAGSYKDLDDLATAIKHLRDLDADREKIISCLREGVPSKTNVNTVAVLKRVTPASSNHSNPSE